MPPVVPRMSCNGFLKVSERILRMTCMSAVPRKRRHPFAVSCTTQSKKVFTELFKKHLMNLNEFTIVTAIFVSRPSCRRIAAVHDSHNGREVISRGDAEEVKGKGDAGGTS